MGVIVLIGQYSVYHDIVTVLQETKQCSMQVITRYYQGVTCGVGNILLPFHERIDGRFGIDDRIIGSKLVMIEMLNIRQCWII